MEKEKMKYEKSLKLSGRGGDSFVCFPNGDEETALVVSIRNILPTGEVTLTFAGDAYKVWRGSIYEKGKMRK